MIQDHKEREMIPFPIINKYANVAPTLATVKRVRSSSGAVGVLYSTGEFYVRGSQGFYGEFGIGTSSNSYTSWTLIHTNVKDCWMGTNSTIIQLNDNTFFYSGLSLVVGLGSSTSSSNVWVNCTAQFTTLPSLNINKLYIDGNGSMALLDTKQVYAIGNNSSGSFGLGNQTTRTTFTLVTSDVDIFRKSPNNSFLLKGTSLYRAGSNPNGMLGVGNSNSLPTLTLLSGYQVLDVFGISPQTGSTTGASTIRVGSSNYSAGLNSNGAFGNGTTSSTAVTTYTIQATSLPSTFISNALDFNQGLNCNVAKCSDGLYASGVNSSGRLGTGDIATKTSYTLLPNSGSLVAGISDICIGTNFMAVLWNNTQLFMTGALATSFGFPADATTLTQVTLPL